MGAQVLTRALNAKLPLLVVAMGRYSPLPNLAVGKQLVKFLLIGRGSPSWLRLNVSSIIRGRTDIRDVAYLEGSCGRLANFFSSWG